MFVQPDGKRISVQIHVFEEALNLVPYPQLLHKTTPVWFINASMQFNYVVQKLPAKIYPVVQLHVLLI